MPAGSVLISRGGLLHAAGPNTTEDDWRVGAETASVELVCTLKNDQFPKTGSGRT